MGGPEGTRSESRQRLKMEPERRQLELFRCVCGGGGAVTAEIQEMTDE